MGGEGGGRIIMHFCVSLEVDEGRNPRLKYQGRKPRWSPAGPYSVLVRESVHSWHAYMAASSSGWDEKNNQTVIIRSQQVAITSLLF